jgi:hypothetical protein
VIQSYYHADAEYEPDDYKQHRGISVEVIHGATWSPTAAIRLIPVPLPNCETRSASRSAGLSGVQTGPGATALTLIPLSIR